MGGIIGTNIRRVREARSWTQEHLAAAAMVDVRTVQRAEAGKKIAAETLQAIAGALGVPLEELRRDLLTEELTKLVQRYELVPAKIVQTGRDLAACLGVHFTYFTVAVEPTVTQADAIAVLQQLIGDWNDLWEDLGPLERREAETNSLEGEVRTMRELGLSISVARTSVMTRLPQERTPSPWEFAFLAVSKTSEPKKFVVWDKQAPLPFGLIRAEPHEEMPRTS